ncbi:EpsG family protein [uncultured Draconibacterium sp.]|uniref:EpsG family protein n=1 Tax=uncultured Draconibacterium sp. TaxID=1573823 RepID=UPI0025FC0481|nr:EpsG family protein [uncultured Draconibacterium sp.]
MDNQRTVKSHTTDKSEINPYFIVILLLSVAVYFLAPHSDDYSNYQRSFNYGASSRIEPTFLLFTSITKFIGSGVIILYLLYSIIAVPIKLKAIKELSPYFAYSLILYVAYFFLLHEVTQIRASVAVAFFLFSIKPLYDRSFKQFIFLTFCAVLFHYSAFMLIPLWFIKPQKLNKAFYLVLIPISYIIAGSGLSLTYLISFVPIPEIQILLEHHSYAMEQGIGDKINIYNLLQLFRCIICGILILLSDKIVVKNKYAFILLKLYTISVVTVVLFHDLPVVSFRISEFLGVVEVLVLPFLLYFFKQKIIVFSPFVLLFLYHSLYNLNLLNIF